MSGRKAPRLRRPWYLRPFPLIALASTLLLVLATVPPLMAEPTPVNLNEEGQRNAEEDGWEAIELDAQATVELLGGFVTMESHALQKNDEDGYPLAGYTWATLKIPAMLPRDLVEDRLQEAAPDIIQEVLNGMSIDPDASEGIRLDTDPIQESTFNGNGHDVRLTRYQADARLSKQLPEKIVVDDDERLHGEAIVATWRCSVLGSYAIAIAVARDEPDYDGTLDGATEALDDPLDNDLDGTTDGLLADDLGDALDDPGTGHTVTVDEVQLLKSGSQHIQEIQNRLLANTVCGE